MRILAFEGERPRVHETAYLADGAKTLKKKKK